MAWYNFWKPKPKPAPEPIKEYAPLPKYVPSKITSETLSTPLSPITTTTSRGGGGSSAPAPTKTAYVPSKITSETLSTPLSPITKIDTKPTPVTKAVTLPSSIDTGKGYVKIGFFETIFSKGKGDILSRLDLTTKPKFAEEAYLGETGRPISAEHLTKTQKKLLGKSGFDVKTLGEFKTEADVRVGEKTAASRTAYEKIIGGRQAIFQEKVYSGELDVGTAQTLFDEDISGLNVKFQKEQGQIYQEEIVGKGFEGLGERRSPIRDIVDIAALSNPLTSFIGAKVSMKDDPMIIDIEQLQRGVSIEGATTQRPSARTGIFVGGGVLGGYGGLKAAGRAETGVRIESALGSLEKQYGVQITKGDIVGELSLSLGKSDGGIALGGTKIFSKGGKFIGEQDVVLVAKEFFTGKPILFSETKMLAGKGAGVGLGEDLTFSLSEVRSAISRQLFAMETKKGVQSELRYFTKPPNIQKDFFAGLSRKQGDLIYSIGGKADIGANIIYGKGFKALKDIRVGFEAETTGVTRILGTTPKKDIISFGGRGGTVTKLDKTFASQISIKPPVVKLPSSKTDFIGGGLGGLKQKDIVGEQKFMDTGFISPKIKTKVRGKSKPKVITRTSSALGLSQKDFVMIKQKDFQNMFQPVKSASRLKELQITIPIQRQGLKQKQIQDLVIDPFISARPKTGFKFGGRAGGLLGFGFPLLKPILSKPKGKSPKSERVLGRTPSFAAVTLGKTSFEPMKGEFSGLIERPILIKKKRKKI